MSTNASSIDDLNDTREVKCPVHGYIPISKLAASIIDTPQFQRLRYLKQLGTSYYVWPGASHNRFEHALGVYHLASEMVRRLQRSQPELQITERDVRCVEVAGLCHDLGHGPFSHVWDNTFIPNAIPKCEWKHEDASEMMLDYLVEDNNIDLQPDEVRFIKDLIQGSKHHTRHQQSPEKDFLFEIIANKRNGIDVDKFDYIARDSRAVADGTTTDLKRLVHTARVIDGQICYSSKNTITVYSLFQERFNLHKMIYNHKTAKSIEYMIVDALLKADPVLKISERIFNQKQFMFLTDDIILEVERSEAPELEESRRIIRRIRTRDLYRMVDKMYQPWESRQTCVEFFTPARILEAARALPAETLEIEELIRTLKEEHIIVDVTAIHYGMGQKFPLENCMFYGKYEPNKAYPPRRADISHLLPNNFGELLIRVYTRDSDYFGIIQHAARSLLASLTPTDAAYQPDSEDSQSFKRQRSTTPEIPKTPPLQLTQQLSNASILSEGGDIEFMHKEHNQIRNQTLRTDPSTPIAVTKTTVTNTNTLTRTTPLFASTTPNNYMTVPKNFTPKTPKSCVKMRQDVESVLSGGGDFTPGPKLLQRKKRQLQDLEEEDEKNPLKEERAGEEIGGSKSNKTTVFDADKKKKMRT